MTETTATCAWWRSWPSRSRKQGEAFGGSKGEPEDEEMRSATGVIQVCVDGDSVIYCAGILSVQAGRLDRG